MKKILVLLCVINVVTIGLAQVDNCSEPRVAVFFDGIVQVTSKEVFFSYANSYYTPQTEEMWINQIKAEVLKDLKSISPTTEFVEVSGSVPDEFDYYFSYSLSVTGSREKIRIPGPDDIYRDKYTGFQIESRFGTRSACGTEGMIISAELTWDRELMIAIFRNVAELGDLEPRIFDYEESHPLPPRGPEMTISIKKEYVSPIQGNRSMDIKIDVTNCEGEVVYGIKPGQKVALQEKTERAELEPTRRFPQGGGQKYAGGLILEIIKPVGASATFTLKNGIDTDMETVKILTCGRDKKVTKIQDITIRGLELEVNPDRQEITDPDGNEYPVEGKDLQVKVTGLQDGDISTKGGYTTNDRGEVIMIYKAGNNDKMINITASFQPVDWPDKVEGKGTIRVKPLEYDATLTLKATYEQKIEFDTEEITTNKNCESTIGKGRRLNEKIESSIYVDLKLIERAEMPMYNQTWEYYEPINVNLALFNLFSNDKRADYGNHTGNNCAEVRYETNVQTQKTLKNKEIEGVTNAVWIVAFDNESGKALKIIPGGYDISYEYDEKEDMNSVIWSDNGTTEKSDSQTKTRERSFAFGPVEDPEPDPTAKSSDQWLQDYIKENIGDLPLEIAAQIPKTDPEELESEINPDVIVQFGDGIAYFGGDGRKELNQQIEGGFKLFVETYRWQMTRKKRN
ncbi:hypothetical protein [uncultured Muriicola sp.]|uniref:hypothetical protein n=1 Tax=uncultured Muriicola sp. TaxID=1583102 RepID=UPI00261EDF0C|nr:hypothetical protein [uncultured Muriicola sp.]